MKQTSYVVTANYKDREDANRWMIRKSEEGPSDAKAYPYAIAKGVTLTCSLGHPEQEFGCSVLALSEQAAGYTEQPDFSATAERVPLTYRRGIAPYLAGEDNQRVLSAEELHMDADGRMYAVSPVYAGQEVLEDEW